jgi:type II secretion system protein J
MNKRGFTLIEIIVASVLLALIAGSTTLVLARSLKTRDASGARQDAMSRAQSAATLIANDIAQAAREPDLRFGLVRVIPSGGLEGRDEVLMLARTGRTVRSNPEIPEGPVHEVQYRVVDGPSKDEPAALWRREDPYVDDFVDAGGVATPIVPGIVELKVEAYDGNSWSSQWDSDELGYPVAVRVTATATGAMGSTSERRTARAIVAIDRTPLPGTITMPPEATASTGNTTTPGTGTGTGTGQFGGGNGGGNTGGGGGGGGRPGGAGPPGGGDGAGGGRPGGGRPGGGGGGGQPGGPRPGGGGAPPGGNQPPGGNGGGGPIITVPGGPGSGAGGGGGGGGGG